MMYPVIGWLLWVLDAPMWVWVCFIIKALFDLSSLPMVVWLVRQYQKRDGK